MRRVAVIAISAAVALVAVSAYAVFYAFPFVLDKPTLNKADQEWLISEFGVETCIIFYGVMFFVGRFVGSKLLDAESVREIAESGRNMHIRLHLLGGLMMIAGRLFIMSRIGWGLYEHWIFVLIGLVLFGNAIYQIVLSVRNGVSIWRILIPR
jgi:hypothetical protein